MKNVLICVVSGLVVGCASFIETTGTSGVSFGMSKQEVLQRIQKTDKIISVSDDTIVAEGLFLGKKRLRKIFTFRDDRLVETAYPPLPESETNETNTAEHK